MRDLTTKFYTVKWQVQKQQDITFEQAIDISVKTLLEFITPVVTGIGSMYDYHCFECDGGKYKLYLNSDSMGRGSDSKEFVRHATPEETKVLEVIEMLKSKGR